MSSPSLVPRVDVELFDDLSNLSISRDDPALSASDDEWEPPDYSLQLKIVQQVEILFSNSNLLKDAFLLKHVRKNKDGYVNIKLITSFKRVKCLTKDWRHVAYSLQHSRLLTLNPERTKVRRMEPVPDIDETAPSRTVVAFNFPTGNPSIAYLGQLFSQCGAIASVRVYRQGKTLPSELKKHLCSRKDLKNTSCCVIEFEELEATTSAIEFGETNDIGIIVEEFIVKRAKRKKRPDSPDSRSDSSLRLPDQNSLSCSNESISGSSDFGSHLSVPQIVQPSQEYSPRYSYLQGPTTGSNPNQGELLSPVCLDLGYASSGSPWLSPTPSNENLSNNSYHSGLSNALDWCSLKPTDISERRYSDTPFLAVPGQQVGCDLSRRSSGYDTTVFSPNYHDKQLFNPPTSSHNIQYSSPK